jgi:ubiquinone biosynthesis monooxygenase Coq7
MSSHAVPTPTFTSGPELDPTLIAGLTSGVPGLLGDLRSDHAGETGAVAIYRGILAVTRDQQIRHFAKAHLATEIQHLSGLDELLPRHQRSALLPVWHIAGWLTGALPAIVGPGAVYATIDAVETFVDHHYEQQVQKLSAHGPAGVLRAFLLSCQADEVHHRDEARTANQGETGAVMRLWQSIVAKGSALAVEAARRV